MADTLKPNWTLHHADVLEWARTYDGPKFHALLSDPPAGISFMGKQWDHDKGGRDEWVKWLTDVMLALREHLLPGAHVLMWALPRTSHWTATAIENAGFEIRDVCNHCFGSGFPKSLNVGLALDKAAGAEREVIGHDGKKAAQQTSKIKTAAFGDYNGNDGCITNPATPDAKTWDGYGTALKPASEHWILARKPIEEATVAANCVAHGAGALNIDGGRVETVDQTAREWDENQIHSLSAWRKMAGRIDFPVPPPQTGGHPSGRWPANLLLSHSPSCRLVGTKKVVNPSGSVSGNEPSFTGDPNTACYGEYDRVPFQKVGDADGCETVEVWECEETCPVRIMDEQSGQTESSDALRHNDTANKNGGSMNRGSQEGTVTGGFADTGGASRFFHNSGWHYEIAERLEGGAPFYYQAKSSTAERQAGLGSVPAITEHGTTLRKVENAIADEPAGGGDGVSTAVRNTHPT